MNAGITILNKLKENQNQMLALKKVADEIHLEIITKTKELNCYNETITSDELKVKERRAAIAEMELQKHNFDQSLVIWEKILEEKSRVLEKEKENMRKLAHHASVDRINYCDKVNNFLVQNGDFTKTYVANKVTSSDYSDVEIQELQKEIIKLEQELETQKKIFQERKYKILIDRMNAEEIRLEKVLEHQKCELKRLTDETKYNLQKKCEKQDCNFTAVIEKNNNPQDSCIQNIASYPSTSSHNKNMFQVNNGNLRPKFTPKRAVFSRSIQQFQS